jgi:hypothetical protein
VTLAVTGRVRQEHPEQTVDERRVEHKRLDQAAALLRPGEQLTRRSDRVREVLESLSGLLAVHGSEDLTPRWRLEVVEA